MEKLSQAPLGSNPATAEAYGLDNQLLNGEEQGVTPSELKDFLNKMIRYGNDDNMREELLSELQDKMAKLKDPDIKNSLNRIGNALSMANNKRKSTRDPLTGEKDPDSTELSRRLLEKLEAFNKEGSKVYNHKIAQKTQLEKKKKKTRGNPFRVLMGKVGKLLDHGIEKKDIVRYLAKLKYWNNETIERAVDIVRDYNRKKERKEREEDTEKTASSNSNIRLANIYEHEADFTKRSTGELVMRACFLMDLMEVDKNTKQGDFKDPADKTGAKDQLKKIKKALVERGFDKEELSNLGLGE